MPLGPKGSHRVSDLAGCQVVTEAGESLGKLVTVIPTKGNDVFVVQSEKYEYLIPALKTVVIQIDLENRRIVVRLPEGLRELYEGL